MIIDEPQAIEEIKRLSQNAKLHLCHVYRNFAQRISVYRELKQEENMKDEIFNFVNELKKMGL